MRSPSREARMAPMTKLGNSGQPRFTARVATEYTPTPKKAPWPKLKYPLKPVNRFQLEACEIQKNRL